MLDLKYNVSIEKQKMEILKLRSEGAIKKM